MRKSKSDSKLASHLGPRRWLRWGAWHWSETSAGSLERRRWRRLCVSYTDCCRTMSGTRCPPGRLRSGFFLPLRPQLPQIVRSSVISDSEHSQARCWPVQVERAPLRSALQSGRRAILDGSQSPASSVGLRHIRGDETLSWRECT